MKITDFNFSKDLVNIFIKSVEYSIKSKKIDVSMDVIIYCGIRYYLENDLVESKKLKDYFRLKTSMPKLLDLVEKHQLKYGPYVGSEWDEFRKKFPQLPLNPNVEYVLKNIQENLIDKNHSITFNEFVYFTIDTINSEDIYSEFIEDLISLEYFESDLFTKKPSLCDLKDMPTSAYIKDEDLNSTLDEFKDLFNSIFGNGDKEETRRLDWSGLSGEEKDNRFEQFGNNSDAVSTSTKKLDPNSKTPFLDEFATDMTFQAKNGKYDPVIGRDKEISQIFEILACRKKNSVALLGDPGCGKSAIAEGIAQKIASHDCPDIMKDKRLMMLDVNAMVAGTQFRGQFEQRVQGILKECVDNKNLIIFIDEFHSTLSAGGNSSDGSGLSQLLKPALSRGEITCIASTTYSEYTKFVEKDGALKRRFQNVMIMEPGISETIDILTALSESYSKFHKVKYTPEVIKACVILSDRYIFNRSFPDKAIDILDISGSLAQLEKPRELDCSEIDKTRSEIEKTETDICSAVYELNDLEEGERLRKDKIKLSDKLEKLKKNQELAESDQSKWPEVTIKNVASVISKIAKVPVEDIIKSDTIKLRGMKQFLESEVIGQSEAIEKLVTSLQLNTLGLRDQNKPIGSFLFLGKTGTGKTYVCQKLAEKLFGTSDALITYSMGELADSKLGVSAFKGATAGYIGYGDTDSVLFEKVRKRPHSVVLFDEVEKADPKFFDLLLNILQEGWTTLSNGQIVSFKNTIIVMTGNLGTKELIASGNGFGFSKPEEGEKKKLAESIVMSAAKKFFRPEFLNRLTGITIFNDFTGEDYSKIFDLELKKLTNRLSERGYTLDVSEDLKNKIISEIDKNYGARDLTREINRWIQVEICKKLISLDESVHGSKITATIEKNNKVNIDIV